MQKGRLNTMPKVTLTSHEYDHLGDAIRTVMAARRILTQRDLAKRMHESPANVSNWIAAASNGNIKAWQLERIASVLKVTVLELYTLASEPEDLAENCMRLIC